MDLKGRLRAINREIFNAKNNTENSWSFFSPVSEALFETERSKFPKMTLELRLIAHYFEVSLDERNVKY